MHHLIEQLEGRTLFAVDLIPVMAKTPTGSFGLGEVLAPLKFHIHNQGNSDVPPGTAIEFSVYFSTNRKMSGRVATFHAFYRGPVFSGEPILFDAPNYGRWDDTPPHVPTKLATGGNFYIGVRINNAEDERHRVPETNTKNNLVWSRKRFSVGSTSRILRIDGTEGDDIIAVVIDGLGYTVIFNEQRTHYGTWPFEQTKFYGLGGNDRLSVTSLLEGRTNVTLVGGAGNDRVVGFGRFLSGADGNDTIVGEGKDSDSLFGGAGKDRLHGSVGDVLDGGFGLDRLYGAGIKPVNARNDFVNGVRKPKK